MREGEKKNGGAHVYMGFGGPLGIEVERGKFGGVWKMQTYIEVLLELDFSPNLQTLEYRPI
jgi:hypothetical protein